ncbi:O-methyltransferase [Streptomyces sp. AN091965]|uniref:O-methyltransferase n=1 Tax=Streptomyces sp. AN091965 TaxID=2927803 RepID=UPI001F60EF24|nr:O-methyltransferase [Streptomyces sp. AN091965]MCI3930398.1 O-methyltransferase [Streptomyces sp. AN091965]
MTAHPAWTTVDSYFTDLLVPEDEALTHARHAAEAAGLPPISVTPTQGKLLHLLARLVPAGRILEIGTLAAYSTIWLARALPDDGRLITLEFAPAHAAVARANLAHAGLDKVAEVRTGPALDSLAALHAEGTAPFDLVFIDADKANNARYLEWSLKLTRPGGLIVLDNVVRGGGVADAASDDPSILGTREALELIASHPDLDGTAVQTVGDKGYDGFALARVRA